MWVLVGGIPGHGSYRKVKQLINSLPGCMGGCPIYNTGSVAAWVAESTS